LSGDWSEPPIYDQDKLYDTIEVLIEIGSERGVSAAQIALAYLIGKPAVTSVIVGARTEAQLADNLASANLTLSHDEVTRLTQSAPSRFATRTGTRPEHRRPAEPGRSQPARQPHRLTRARSGTSRQRKVIRLTPCPRIIKFNSSTKYRGGL